jgi:hypothetical protein
VGLPDLKGFVAREGLKLEPSGTPSAFKALPDEFMLARGNVRVFHGGTQYYDQTYDVNLSAWLKGQPESTTYFATLLRSPRQQVYRLELGAKNTTVWLNGVEVTADALVNLGVGYVPLVVRVDASKLPPVGKFVMSLKFQPEVDPSLALATWRDSIRRYRDVLNLLVKEMPDTGHAVRAQSLLKELE